MKNKNRILTESQKRQITENKEKAILESFASTFNKIKRIDENAIDEIGPRMAAKALGGGTNDPRAEKLQKDAITSMFSGFIGKDKPFFIQTRQDTDPVKFMLVEVVMHNEIVAFHFYNETGEDDDARFAPNKKEITIKYNLKEDEFNDETYLFNRFTINFFVKAANLIREAYYTRFAPKAKAIDKDGEVEREWNDNGGSGGGAYQDKYINDPSFEIASKVNKNRFRMFNFDSKNLMNKGIDESEETMGGSGLDSHLNDMNRYQPTNTNQVSSILEKKYNLEELSCSVSLTYGEHMNAHGSAYIMLCPESNLDCIEVDIDAYSEVDGDGTPIDTQYDIDFNNPEVQQILRVLSKEDLMELLYDTDPEMDF